MPTRQVYTYLLEDDDVKRWYRKVVRGSVITVDVYLRYSCSVPTEAAASAHS